MNLKPMRVYFRPGSKSLTEIGDYSGDTTMRPSSVLCPFCQGETREATPVNTVHRIVKILRRLENGDVDAIVTDMPKTIRLFACRACFLVWTLPKKRRQ